MRDTVGWHTARELLEANQYEQVAELLRKAQAASEQKGETILADTLSAAYQICLASSQCRAEVEWHQQVCEEADQREQGLRQQLCALLDLISRCETPETKEKRERPPNTSADAISQPERSTLYSKERRGLWQRIQDLLGQWATPELLKSGTRAKAAKAEAMPNRESKMPGLCSIADARAKSVLSVGREKLPEQKTPSLVVYCLGSFRVYNNEQRVKKWPGNKCKCIFKYIIVHRERPIHHEILMDLFWRDVDPEAARRNLYQAVYSLRQALQSNGYDFPYVLCEDSCYRLNPDLDLWVDSEAFTAHYQIGQQLEREGRLEGAIQAYERAENLYKGEFLPEDRYEDWPLIHRENLKHAHLDILDRLSQYHFDHEQFSACSSFCQKMLAEDNCREDAHRRLIRCYLRQGQRHLALRQYHLCVEALERELDVPPMSATVELYQQMQKSRFNFRAPEN